MNRMNTSVQLFGKQLSIITNPAPSISYPNDVIIRVAYSGVCGTDLHILAGEFPASKEPVTLGHEFCGIVDSVGKDVLDIQVGDRVVVNPGSQCHICEYCRGGKPNFCKSGGIRSGVGVWKNGGWAIFCKVEATLVYRIPDKMPLELAVFTEPFSCLARGWDLLGDIEADVKVLVCGAGIIGLFWCSLFHYKGFREMVITEISEKRRTLACNLNLELGVMHPDELVKGHEEAIRTGNEDWGFDIIVDCTGVPVAIEQSIKYLRRGGKFLLFGCCPKESTIQLNPFDIYYKEVKIIGSHINPFTFPKALALVRGMKNYLDYNKLGINTFQLQNYSDALEALKSGMISKAVFDVDSSCE